MSEPVSAKFLLQGAAYALEQCGLLLRDANLLYRNGSFATSLAVAAFAREELGRWSILLDLRQKVLEGAIKNVKEVEEACVDHVKKHKASVRGISVRFDGGSSFSRLATARWESTPGSEAWTGEPDHEKMVNVNSQIKKVVSKKRERRPDDLHKHRLDALYVGPTSASLWHRPISSVSKTRTLEYLEEAVGDYVIAYEQEYLCEYTDVLKETNLELFAALSEWTERPTLPAPDYPPYPAQSGNN